MTSTKAVFLAFAVVLVLAGAASAQPTGCTPVAPGIVDPTFEAGTPWPGWTVQTSTVFGTPLCDLLSCGTGGGVAGPFAGNNWAWFGGTDSAENASVGQSVAIPGGPFLFLRFRLRIGAVATPFTDTLTVRVDATNVLTFTEPAVAEPAYTEHYVNVTAFANGASHAVSFNYAHPAGTLANFTVDNVELLTCTTPVELIDYKIE
jgi:hypothetical protein